MIEETQTIDPAPRLRMAGTAGRTTRIMPLRSISKVWSHFSSLSSSSGTLWAIPALATMQSMGPCRFSTAPITASACEVEVTSSR